MASSSSPQLSNPQSPEPDFTNSSVPPQSLGVESQIQAMQVVFQDDSDPNYPGRFKPYLLSAEGIHYDTVIIPASPELLSLGAVATPYGAFCLQPVKAPSWVFIGMASMRALMAKQSPIAGCVVGSPGALLILGLKHPFTLDELKQAYKRLAKQYHPDVNPGDDNAAQRFAEVSAAYQLLLDYLSQQTELL